MPQNYIIAGYFLASGSNNIVNDVANILILVTGETDDTSQTAAFSSNSGLEGLLY